MKTGVVLFNLGGPKTLKDVRGFLFNLFADKAIIGAPLFIRLPLALLISTLRNAKAQGIYAAIGGGSPLLEKTQAQADALQNLLGDDYKIVIAMRYAAPRAKAAIDELKKWGADKIIYLPMYPQFSTATTGSSFAECDKYAGITPVSRICCYPEMGGFAQSLAALIRPEYEKLEREFGKPRLLLSAHGLPEKTIAAGDPYAWQCEKSAYAVVKALNIPDLDWDLCYQSRVGPLEWIKPYTEAEIRRAGEQKKPLLIAPLAFTADNSETTYEIDQLYRDLALESGCPGFASTPCVGASPLFIEGLAALVKRAQTASGILCPPQRCPDNFSGCACRQAVVE